MVSAVRLSRQVVGCRAAGRLGEETRRTRQQGVGCSASFRERAAGTAGVDHGKGGRVRRGRGVMYCPCR